MIGKFINPIVSGGAPPTPSNKGIYIISHGDASKYEGLNFDGISEINNSDLSIEPSFSIPAPGFFRDIGSAPIINDMVEQSDGKFIIVGLFRRYVNIDSGGVVRVNPDFSIDTTFNNGQIGAQGANIRTVKIQSDGKILIGGEQTIYNGVSNQGRITRLNTDGLEDTTFIKGTGFNGTVNIIVIQPDEKILVGGAFTSYNGTTANRLIRLNSNGTIDTSFNIGAGFNSLVNDINLLPSGKLYVGGNFSTNNIILLNSNGSTDTSFNVNAYGFAYQNVNSIVTQSDGKVVLGGTFASTGSSGPAGIVRLNPIGNIDTSFNAVVSSPVNYKPGFYVTPVVNFVYQQPDGKFIVCGGFRKFQNTYSYGIIRLNNDGSVDTAFNQYFFTPFYSFTKIFVSSTNKIYLIGQYAQLTSEEYLSDIFRLENYNTIDKTKLVNNIFNTPSSISAVEPIVISFINDDQIVLNIDSGAQVTTSVPTMGRFIKLDRNLLPVQNERLNDIRLVNSYAGNITIRSYLVTSDNKILMSGSPIVQYDDTRTVRNIIRMNSDGSRDTTFNTLNGFPEDSTTQFATLFCEAPGLKYYVFTLLSNTSTYSGVTVRGAIRINNDGSLDSTFVSNSFFGGVNTNIIRALVQPDGKLVFIGTFTSVQSIPRRFMCRLNTNGTVDSSFDPGFGFGALDTPTTTVANSSKALAIQPDGKFIVVGGFYFYNGTLAKGIVRINTDGSIDSSFVTGSGFDSYLSGGTGVEDLKIASDGKIYIVGSFYTYNGNRCNGYCVLDSDGTFIPTGIQFGRSTYSIAIKE
jgi:uncharacterized delta-60 repeat protein